MRLFVIAALALGLAACEPPAAPPPSPDPLPVNPNPDCPPDTQCVEP